MDSLEGIPESQKDCTEAMHNGNFANCVFPFVIAECAREHGMRQIDMSGDRWGPGMFHYALYALLSPPPRSR